MNLKINDLIKETPVSSKWGQLRECDHFSLQDNRDNKNGYFKLFAMVRASSATQLHHQGFIFFFLRHSKSKDWSLKIDKYCIVVSERYLVLYGN